ncbi:hypothetical protein DITRI_Ditri02bG0069700 [Diplodiscus trichospermus]
MVGVASSDNIHLVDDFYFSALHDDEEIFPISDEKYAIELQLQEALMSSAISSRVPNGSRDLQMCQLFHSGESREGKKKEIGESSNSQTRGIFCPICMDVKPIGEMFRSNACAHLFFALEPQICRLIVPGEVFDRWENALCESLILGSQKLYCPFRVCSALLVDDGGSDVAESECPNCQRLFCAQCKVEWHAGISCSEFQNLSKHERSREDILVMELAKNNKWRRSPNCKIYVEKTQGCLRIPCRCGFHFCYCCGSLWSHIHKCA